MIKITADSTCDLPKQVLEKYNISLVPLHVLVGDVDYKDGVDITPAHIFDFVGNQNKSCKTAAVNVFEYEQFFAPLAEQYEAIIHISLSSNFSSCHNNARLAATEFDNVYVVDSKNLSTGSGHLILDAAEMANSGHTPQQIVEKLIDKTNDIDASFVIDKLDYLHKGGRCSGVEAIGASLLKIKPSIEVTDGNMKVGKKYRGKFERCLERYIQDKLENQNDIDTSRLFITHCMCSPEIIEYVNKLVNQYIHFTEVIVSEAGCTISSHCGPNTLGILFKRK